MKDLQKKINDVYYDLKKPKFLMEYFFIQCGETYRLVKMLINDIEFDNFDFSFVMGIRKNDEIRNYTKKRL